MPARDGPQHNIDCPRRPAVGWVLITYTIHVYSWVQAPTLQIALPLFRIAPVRPDAEIDLEGDFQLHRAGHLFDDYRTVGFG